MRWGSRQLPHVRLNVHQVRRLAMLGRACPSTQVDSSAPMASLTSDNVEGVHHGDQVTTTVPDYVQMQTSSSWSTFSSANNSSATTRPSDANSAKNHSPSQLHVHNASTIPVASIYPTPPAGVQYPTGTQPYGAPSGYSYPPFAAPIRLWLALLLPHTFIPRAHDHTYILFTFSIHVIDNGELVLNLFLLKGLLHVLVFLLVFLRDIL